MSKTSDKIKRTHPRRVYTQGDPDKGSEWGDSLSQELREFHKTSLVAPEAVAQDAPPRSRRTGGSRYSERGQEVAQTQRKAQIEKKSRRTGGSRHSERGNEVAKAQKAEKSSMVSQIRKNLAAQFTKISAAVHTTRGKKSGKDGGMNI